MDTRTLLGHRLRELRKKRGLTQEQLSEKASMDVKYLGNIERGKENPTLATLEKLAEALSVKLHQLLNVENELRDEQVLRQRLTQIVENCNEGELRMILRLVSVIKD